MNKNRNPQKKENCFKHCTSLLSPMPHLRSAARDDLHSLEIVVAAHHIESKTGINMPRTGVDAE